MIGVSDSLFREKLLYEKNLSMSKACKIVRACESSKAQLSQIATKPAPEAAHAI